VCVINGGEAEPGQIRKVLMKLNPMARVTAFIGLCAALVGCGSFSTLQTIVEVTEAAIPIIQSAGVPIPAEVPEYVAAVAGCIGSQVGTPNAQQILAISGCLSKQIAPTLPAGTPQIVANIISSIIRAVSDYLAKNPAPVTSAAPRVTRPLALSPSDTVKLGQLRDRAAVVSANAKALVKR